MRTHFLGAVAVVGLAPLVASVRPQELGKNDHVEEGKESPKASLLGLMATHEGLLNSTNYGRREKSCDGAENYEVVTDFYTDDKCSPDGLYRHHPAPTNKQCFPSGPGKSFKVDCETKKVQFFNDVECKTVAEEKNLGECHAVGGPHFVKYSCVPSTQVLFEFDFYQGDDCEGPSQAISFVDLNCFRSGFVGDGGKAVPDSSKITVTADKIVTKKFPGSWDCSGEAKEVVEVKLECEKCLPTPDNIGGSMKIVRCEQLLKQVKEGGSEPKSGSATTSWNAVICMSVLFITLLLIQQ